MIRVPLDRGPGLADVLGGLDGVGVAEAAGVVAGERVRRS
jgi:hypothetical protein